MTTDAKHSVADAAIFAHCTAKQRQRLDQLSTPVEVRAGYMLTQEGHSGREFGVIISGSATVTVGGREVAKLGAGDHYGEVALLDHIGHTHGKRMATVTTDVDSWVAVMSVSEFTSLLAEFPDVADAVKRSARDRAGIRD